jgi:hypothetical protein
MSGSIAAIITLGFGTFGSVNLLPTIGYGVGAAATAIYGRLEFTVPADRLEFTIPAERLEFTVQPE